MPNPHFRIQPVGRTGGRSVIAAAAYRSGEALSVLPSVVGKAAYRAGETLTDGQGQTFDYTRKEGIEWSHIFTPEQAPAWARNRQELWNRAEAAEARRDARLAREIEMSLPREVEPERWRVMVAEMAEQFTQHGLVADVSIHNVQARDGGDNPHAHFLVTDRPMDAKGFRRSKSELRFLNSHHTLRQWRDRWETITNDALRDAGVDTPFSLRSYRERGIDREATITLGPEATALERMGVPTEAGDHNRAVRQRNAVREAHKRSEAVGSDAPPSATRSPGRDEGKLRRFLRHAARDVVGGYQKQNRFHQDEQALYRQAEDTLRGFNGQDETPAQRRAAHRKLGTALEYLLHLERRTLKDASQIADALATFREQTQREEEARAASSSHGREPLWSSFSLRLTAEVDASRDAVHRWRQKEDSMSDEATERVYRRQLATPAGDDSAAAVSDANYARLRSAAQPIHEAGAVVRDSGTVMHADGQVRSSAVPDARAGTGNELARGRATELDQQRSNGLRERQSLATRGEASDAAKNNSASPEGPGRVSTVQRDMEKQNALAGTFNGRWTEQDMHIAGQRIQAQQKNQGRDDR